jgi:hypothetical protein
MTDQKDDYPTEISRYQDLPEFQDTYRDPEICHNVYHVNKRRYIVEPTQNSGTYVLRVFDDLCSRIWVTEISLFEVVKLDSLLEDGAMKRDSFD